MNQEKRQGQVSPSRFIQTVRQRDRRFRNTAHQDAQEFLNFTLDALVEVIQKFQQRRAQSNAACQSESMGHRNGVQDSVRRDLQSATTPVTGYSARCSESGTAHGQGDSAGSIRVQATPAEQRSFVHDIFCGKTVTHTRCMNCEAQSKREENFMELTLDIEQQDTTLEQCMLAFRCAPSLRKMLLVVLRYACRSTLRQCYRACIFSLACKVKDRQFTPKPCRSVQSSEKLGMALGVVCAEMLRLH